MSAPPQPVPPGPPGLTPEQFQVLTDATARARRVFRAATVALVSGWTMVGFAVITGLAGLFGLPALLLGLALGGVAWNELQGAKGLRTLDLAAPRRLALNQLALFGAILLYGAWGIGSALLGPGAYDAQIAAGGQVAEMLEPIDRLTKAVTVVFYAAVIIGSMLLQGMGAAWYYSRRRHIEACLRETPDWATETLRAAA